MRINRIIVSEYHEKATKDKQLERKKLGKRRTTVK